MPSNEEPATIELRGQCPREIVDVLDAICVARRINRTDLVNRILKVWASDRLHESTLIQRVTRGNPALPETQPGELD